MNVKGTLPMLILQVLERGPRHGYRIAQEIRTLSDGVLDLGEGTLYPALHAYENHGLLESQEVTENGRRRRYYSLTEAGRKALAEQRDDWRNLVAAVDLILGEA